MHTHNQEKKNGHLEKEVNQVAEKIDRTDKIDKVVMEEYEDIHKQKKILANTSIFFYSCVNYKVIIMIHKPLLALLLSKYLLV